MQAFSRPTQAYNSLVALGRAVAFGRWRTADVRSILAAGAGTVVPVRFSLADYALGGESATQAPVRPPPASAALS